MNDYRYYCTSSDELSHHGVQGMHWGQRNGPPYPLQTFQKRVGDAVAKGKRVLADATTATGKALVKVYKTGAEKTKARIAEERAKQKAEKEDIARRKAEAAKRAKLINMAKKHPELLSYQELSDLNNRANQESNFKKNYNPTKKGNNAVKQSGQSLLKDVVTPGAVALGKAAVMSAVGGGDFQKIASVQLGNAYNGQVKSGQNQGKNKPGLGKQPSGKAKKK